ncbi:l-asparaginase ii [Phlyctema vagabunda]|uniref:L-asparaginase ii n=1 Tax=Phlyctema vagabunda TaxID=108571 RepID=A0ABR4PIC4_9HELO
MTRTLQHEDVVVTDRGGIVENRHAVHAAVVDAQGKLLFSVGNPSRMTLARSAAKPAQALTILESGGFKQFGFDDADLALMCASHSSEDKHVARARAMLLKCHAEEKDLHCGGHPAVSPTVNLGWIKTGYSPTAACSNCSGKHVGMLAAAQAIGADMTTYHLPDNPLQLRVKRVVEELCGLEPEGVKWGIDGCNLPTPAFPLQYLGRMYATIAAAADTANGAAETVNGATSKRERTQNLAQIFQAMASYPDLVGGDGRFCTVLMKVFDGVLIGKIGADACYGIGIRASEQTRRLGADGAIGISVKIEDGNVEILYAAVVEILEQLQIGTLEVWQELEAFHHLKLRNTMNIVTGRVSFPFKVRAS